jgi:hypothetical protein
MNKLVVLQFVDPAKPGGDPDIVLKVPGDIGNKVAADGPGVRGMNVFGEFILLFIPITQTCSVGSDPEVRPVILTKRHDKIVHIPGLPFLIGDGFEQACIPFEDIHPASQRPYPSATFRIDVDVVYRITIDLFSRQM